MKTIYIDTPVDEIVRDDPARSRIFEKLDMDYCRDGKIPLFDACKSKGLDPGTVLAMLLAIDGSWEATFSNPDALGLSELCDHIEQVHHGYLREELPRLDFMTRKVAAVHGDHEPRLLEIRSVFESFCSEIASHTREEDETIFPAIRKLDGATTGGAATTLQSSIGKLEAQHAGADAALEQFKQLTDNYTAPDWACNTFRALYEGLERLEKDMHAHVHKESHVLFPKAIAKLLET